MYNHRGLASVPQTLTIAGLMVVATAVIALIVLFYKPNSLTIGATSNQSNKIAHTISKVGNISLHTIH